MAVPDYEMPKDVVPPGAQTGIYYIPISSLPFNVSWQQIKDYVRQVCEVDHVEIFQKSTSGWVRVKGRENFDKAFAHLNGKEFNGRAIIADGRNVDHPILVRDLRVCKPTGSSGRSSSGGGVSTAAAAPESPQSHAAGGLVSYPDPSMLASPTSTTSSSYSQQGGSYHVSLPPSNYMASPEASFSDSVMSGSGYHNSHLATGFSTYGFQTQQSFMSPYGSDGGPQAIYGPPVSYAVQSPYSNFYPTATGALTNQMAGMALGGGDGVIYTEQRGIQIRDISRRATGNQIRKMIREVTGPEAHLINGIEIPDDKDGNTRGLAFVHFGTADLARRMARHLNGVEFKGRKLQVRLMKDGEEIGGGASTATLAGPARSAAAGSSSKPDHRGSKHSSLHHQANKDDRRRAERKDKAVGSASRFSHPSSGSKTVPLVVGGHLTAKSAPSSKDKGKDKEKHSGSSSSSSSSSSKESSIVIADGSSSGRRPSDSDKR